jgi:glycosyltransferase involved in cell wall biosynthesis
MKALAIIPALNEERNLPLVLAGLQQHAPGWDACVIDDGSTDRTAQVAAQQGAIVLKLSNNLGIGGAVQTGYRYANEHGYDVAAQIDGDGQHDPAFLRAAVKPILNEEAHFIIGSRYLGAGGFQSTALRRAGIRYLIWFLRLRCGARVTDPTSGFRVVGRQAIELFASQYPSDYPEPEAIGMALRKGLVVREIPVVMRSREHGQSSIGLWRTIYYLFKITLALLLLAPSTRPDRLEDAT